MQPIRHQAVLATLAHGRARRTVLLVLVLILAVLAAARADQPWGRLLTPSVADLVQAMAVPPPPPRRGPGQILPPAPVPPGARVWRVGLAPPSLRIAEAARLAADGDVVEIEAGDYHQEVAVWTQKRLSIRGVNGAARLFADGRVAEGKAIWVLRNGVFDISNIDFIGARAADANGAGIRFEGGALQLRACLFWGNQMGLLTGGEPTTAGATLVVEDSEFAYSQVHGRWGHNLYVGSLASLTVQGSHLHHAGAGHLIKSRARRNQILHNRLTDEAGGRASYELEFPNGGEAVVVGNLIQQQVGTENGVLVSVGAEGYRWPVNTVYLASNTIVNDRPQAGVFLRVAPGADRVVSANNLLIGSGSYQVQAPLQRWGDVQAQRQVLAQPDHHDYRLLRPSAALAHRPVGDAQLAPLLTPQAEYQHPRTSRPLARAPAWVGALQDTVD